MLYYIDKINYQYILIITIPPGGEGREDMSEERKKAVQSLKTAKGQIEGIIKMIEDDRYCIDVANQLLAVQSLIKKADLMILQGHLRHCVKEACLNNNPDEKIEELNKVLEKLLSK
jgi:CsoR family transcriptional regulator, copper-sensing transcriptional repressor